MFKVGDKVVIVDTDFYSDELSVGKTGVVTRESYGLHPVIIGVLMDSGYTPIQFDADQDDAWNFYPSQLELAQ